MKKEKSILLTFIFLAWPTVLEQFLGTILQYVDTAMVGRLGAAATATVSLSTTYSWLINSIMYAFGVGFLSYIARSIGAKKDKQVKIASQQSILVIVTLGIILTLIAFVISPFMPIWMGAEISIRHDASLYFAIINAPLLFRCALIVFGSMIRATGDTKRPMYINVFVNIINVILNYILIYCCSYGAIGAGIATAISYTLGGILMIIVFIKNQRLSFPLHNIHFHFEVMKECIQISIPVMLTQITSCSGYIVFTSFVSSMATTTYAAHSIAITAETLFYIPGYGMQAAVSTLIGHAKGANDHLRLNKVIRSSLSVIFVLMCFSGILLFRFAPDMMRLFTTDQDVITIGASLLRIVAFTEPIFGSAAVMEGIYNGLGKTIYPFYIETFSRWAIRIAGSFVCIHIFSKGIAETWYCMIADNIVKAILLAIWLIILIKGTHKKSQL